MCVCVCACVCPSSPPMTPPILWGWTAEIPPTAVHDPSPPFPHPYPQAIARPTLGKNYPLKSARPLRRRLGETASVKTASAIISVSAAWENRNCHHRDIATLHALMGKVEIGGLSNGGLRPLPATRAQSSPATVRFCGLLGPVLSGLPNSNAKSQRFSYAISQIAPLPTVVALNRNFKSQIAARYAAFWHAVSQIALASFL